MNYGHNTQWPPLALIPSLSARLAEVAPVGQGVWASMTPEQCTSFVKIWLNALAAGHCVRISVVSRPWADGLGSSAALRLDVVPMKQNPKTQNT